MLLKLCYALALSLLTEEVNTARILGIYPMPSISHQVVFRALTYELAKRGHELVVVTPNPGLPKERPPDNITEIDTSHTYKMLEDIFKQMKPKRGVIMTPESFMTPEKYKAILFFLNEILKNKELKAILDDEKQNFDLIIGEGLYYTPAAIARKFNAPMIWFSSFYGTNENFETFGAPARHPLINPSTFRDRYRNLSLWDKIYQTYVELCSWYAFYVVARYEEHLIKRHFDENTPTIDELKNHIDLLFINSNTIFEGNRPLPPNVIALGALHMKPVQELPKELKSFLDTSKRGVVFVSLGTNVRPSNMDPELLEVFLKSFEELPYDILWKFDGDNVPDIPNNVRVQKWFPQRDLLPHPNVKAFITQGGLQSTDEAIDSGVPLVGLPALGDQWFNVEQYERLGIGIKLDLMTLQVEELVNAVKTVINEKSYRENVFQLRKLMRDQKETPLERAVWWTEYVIRHKGAKHLRSIANVTWSEYLMLDVVGIVSGIIALALFVLVRLVKLVWKTLVSGRKLKNE